MSLWQTCWMGRKYDMTITYAVEPLADCRTEIEGLLYEHWLEVARDHDVIPLDPDWSEYERLDASGELHLVICRLDGHVIGYYVTIIRPHLHYKSTLHGFVDVYFLKKEYRHGKIGMQLFVEAEKALKQRGVVKLFSGTKTHLDVSPLFERLGWKTTETLFTKVLKD